MPISFAQPAPAGAFSQIAHQGNMPAFLQAYTSLMNAAQDRYAADRASAGREQLGYAQLNSDAALRREALGLQAAEIQQRPGLQEAAIQMRARAEMDQWIAQQQFTARDAQELNRQRNVIGELMTKRDSGDISDEEFYQMAGSAAPRINALQEREKYTQTQALAEQKRALADQNKAAADMQAQRIKISQMTASDRFHFEMDPTARGQMEAEVDALKPLLRQQNPAQFEIEVRNRAQDHGLGTMYKLQPDGKIEEVKHEKPAGTSGTKSAAGAMTDSQFASLHTRIEKSIRHEAENAGKTLPDEEVKAKVADELKSMGLPSNVAELQTMRDPNAQKQQKIEQGRTAEIAGKEATFAEIQGMPSLSPGAKQAAGQLLGFQKRLIEKFGPYEAMKPDIRAKMDQIASQIMAIKRAAGAENRVVGQGGQ